MAKPIALTEHTKVAMAERALDLAWVARTAREPDWTEPEPIDPTRSAVSAPSRNETAAFFAWFAVQMML